MKCPKDGQALIKSLYEVDIQVDQCKQCMGIYLDNGELEKIQETLKNDYSEELEKIPDFVIRAYGMAREKSSVNLKCPSCGQIMEKKEYGYCSQIIIDICPACHGIWLDKDEVSALEIFFEKSRIETRELRRGFWGSLLNMFR